MKRKPVTVAQVAAAAMKARDPYVLGSKVLLSRVASALGVPLAVLGPRLLALQQSGELTLTRIDLRQAFDAVKGSLARSRLDDPRGGAWYDAIDRSQFR